MPNIATFQVVSLMRKMINSKFYSVLENDLKRFETSLNEMKKIKKTTRTDYSSFRKETQDILSSCLHIIHLS